MTCHTTSLAKWMHTNDNVPLQQGTTTWTTGPCHIKVNTRQQQRATSRTMTHEVDNVPHQLWWGTMITGPCHINNDPWRQFGTTTTGYVDGDRAQRWWEPAWDAFASRAFGKFFYIHFLLCFFCTNYSFRPTTSAMDGDGRMPKTDQTFSWCWDATKRVLSLRYSFFYINID